MACSAGRAALARIGIGVPEDRGLNAGLVGTGVWDRPAAILITPERGQHPLGSWGGGALEMGKVQGEAQAAGNGRLNTAAICAPVAGIVGFVATYVLVHGRAGTRAVPYCGALAGLRGTSSHSVTKRDESDQGMGLFGPSV